MVDWSDEFDMTAMAGAEFVSEVTCCAAAPSISIIPFATPEVE